jgi:hypothetical protein
MIYYYGNCSENKSYLPFPRGRGYRPVLSHCDIPSFRF